MSSVGAKHWLSMAAANGMQGMAAGARRLHPAIASRSSKA